MSDTTTLGARLEAEARREYERVTQEQMSWHSTFRQQRAESLRAEMIQFLARRLQVHVPEEEVEVAWREDLPVATVVLGSLRFRYTSGKEGLRLLRSCPHCGAEMESRSLERFLDLGRALSLVGDPLSWESHACQPSRLPAGRAILPLWNRMRKALRSMPQFWNIGKKLPDPESRENCYTKGEKDFLLSAEKMKL